MILPARRLGVLFLFIPSLAAAQLADANAAPVASCAACVSGLAGSHSVLSAAAVADTVRPKAIEYSDAYYTRLKIHLIASYTEIPLFIGEYFIGEKVLSDERADTLPGVRRQSSLTGVHSTVALGLGALFITNTITGVWNLIESRHDPAGRVRRWLHSILMLVADGGFVATAQAADDAKRSDAGADHHRQLAIESMGLATLSTVMMWLWKD